MVDTLNYSVKNKLESGTFAIYNPLDNTIEEIIPAKYLDSNATDYGVTFNQEMMNDIRDFNNNRIKSVSIGKRNITDGIIINYHTHPLPGQTIFPSVEDSRFMWMLSMPAMIIGSHKLKDRKLPITINWKIRDYMGNEKFIDNGYFTSNINEYQSLDYSDLEIMERNYKYRNIISEIPKK